MMLLQYLPSFFLFSSYIRSLVPGFSLFCLLGCACILFEIRLCGEITVSLIVAFSPIIISGDVVKVYSGVLFLIFYFAFIIPGFPTLGEHFLVADTLRLGFTIRVIIRLEIQQYALYRSNSSWVFRLV